MIKQYVVQQAYVKNDKVSKYIDGKLESSSVMFYWQTEEYCKSLEEQGYSKAYDVVELRAEIEVMKQEYEDALEFYNKVKDKAVVGMMLPEKPTLYWVSTIIFDEGDAKPWLCAISTAKDTLEQAIYQLEFTRKHHNVLSGWIDTFDESNTKQTIFHECYVG